MRFFREVALAAAAFITLSTAAPQPARAQLGGSTADVDAVVTFYGGKLSRTVPKGTYHVHHIAAPQLKILEFVAESTGKVFAVAWEGTRTPKLAPLLGPYSAELSQEMLTRQENERSGAIPRSRLRSPASSLESAHLIVRRFGRPGISQGFVCLKNELPSGVGSCDDVR